MLKTIWTSGRGENEVSFLKASLKPGRTGEERRRESVERKNQQGDGLARPIVTRAGHVIWRKVEAPRPKSRAAIRLAEGTCRNCGFVASHETPEDCITFLRDVISQLAGSDAIESALTRVKAKGEPGT